MFENGSNPPTPPPPPTLLESERRKLICGLVSCNCFVRSPPYETLFWTKPTLLFVPELLENGSTTDGGDGGALEGAGGGAAALIAVERVRLLVASLMKSMLGGELDVGFSKPPSL